MRRSRAGERGRRGQREPQTGETARSGHAGDTIQRERGKVQSGKGIMHDRSQKLRAAGTTQPVLGAEHFALAQDKHLYALFRRVQNQGQSRGHGRLQFFPGLVRASRAAGFRPPRLPAV